MKTRFGVTLTFSIILLAMATTSTHAQTRGLAPIDPPSQNGVSETAKDTEKEKGEVDLKLAELYARHELVLGRCLDLSNCKPMKGRIIDGHMIKSDPTGMKPVNLPQPAYPALARAAHASGTVEVQVIIDEEGKIMAAQVISGHPLLHAASLKAAREARFTPTLLDGKPVKVAGVLNFNFIL